MKIWTHKVVKAQRGMNGEWFRCRAAATFCDAASAIHFARVFALEQRDAGVSGSRIIVVSRRGNTTIADFAVNRGDLPESRANGEALYGEGEVA